METMLMFMYFCAGIACLGIGLGGLGILIAVLKSHSLVRQTVNHTSHPYLLLTPDQWPMTIQGGNSK